MSRKLSRWMNASGWLGLWAVSTVVSAAAGQPGTPTPQPYTLPALPAALPANPQQPPLLRMPKAQDNAVQPTLPSLRPPRKAGQRSGRDEKPGKSPGQ